MRTRCSGHPSPWWATRASSSRTGPSAQDARDHGDQFSDLVFGSRDEPDLDENSRFVGSGRWVALTTKALGPNLLTGESVSSSRPQ
jgi:hypothetical protein